MIVALKMPETTPDVIILKHQVLYGEVMRGVDTGGRVWGGEES